MKNRVNYGDRWVRLAKEIAEGNEGMGKVSEGDRLRKRGNKLG